MIRPQRLHSYSKLAKCPFISGYVWMYIYIYIYVPCVFPNHCLCLYLPLYAYVYTLECPSHTYFLRRHGWVHRVYMYICLCLHRICAWMYIYNMFPCIYIIYVYIIICICIHLLLLLNRLIIYIYIYIIYICQCLSYIEIDIFTIHKVTSIYR